MKNLGLIPWLIFISLGCKQNPEEKSLVLIKQLMQDPNRYQKSLWTQTRLIDDKGQKFVEVRLQIGRGDSKDFARWQVRDNKVYGCNQHAENFSGGQTSCCCIQGK